MPLLGATTIHPPGGFPSTDHGPSATPEILSDPGRFAGFWPRCMALLLDIVLLAVSCGTGAAMTAWKLLPSILGPAALLRTLFLGLPLALCATSLVALGYFVALHAWTGQTVGKWLMGVRVLRQDGSPLGLGLSFFRCIACLVSAFPLGAGFLWIVLDAEQCCWHDRLAGTRVVFREP